ncbi:MAG: acetyl-CoA hydrolase/transferase family protein [Deltaproteobacteria bacterium]|nr:acetyl-CoA hydrolase/transferase family protein [Deltaproteobacteria bacterium]
MYEREYSNKVTTAERAVHLIPARCSLAIGMAVSQPPTLLAAIEARIKAGEVEQLRAYYSHSVPAARAILKYEYMDVIQPHPFFLTQIERELIERGVQERRKVVYYMPGNFSSMPQRLAEIGIDVLIVMVSPMDKAGFFSCGTNGDYTIPTARIARRVIVEVNPQMPRVFGDSAIHISDVEAIVEHVGPLPELPGRPITEIDRKISDYVVEMVPDRATLQIGVGAVPNAVCAALKNHHDLGIHTEMMSPALAALIQLGAVSNKYKNIHRHKNVFTLAAGGRDLYDFLDDNSSMELYGVDHVNDPYVIGQNDKVISINAFLEVGLDGAVNSEAVQGRQYSAPGGQLDFVRGAQLSNGGKSILTAYSTAMGGEVSRIVPKIEGPATDPRADTQYIVTEYGVANLMGKSITERAEALITIAHPRFRDDLIRQAKQLGYL